MVSPGARLLAWLRLAWAWLAAEVKVARAPVRRDGVTVLVPRSMGPLVVGRDTPNPVPLSRVPIRSSKADLRRTLHQIAEQHAGRPMRWKEARKYLKRLEREQPDLEMPMPTARAR